MEIGVKQEKWLKALESGRYKQGTGCLCDSRGNHCCLGVAARSMRQRFIREGSVYSVNGGTNVLTNYTPLGLKSGGGSLDSPIPIDVLNEYFSPDWNYEELGSLWKLNDRIHATFKQIAHFIRQNPERVFTESV